MALKKLVRDRIPEIVEKKTDEQAVVRILDDAEYLHELKWKMLEEVHEANALEKPEEILAELADLKEVLEAYTQALGFSIENLERVQEEKRRERGGFSKRIFLIETKARP